MKGSPYADERVAAVFNRVAGPLQFVLPARDLVWRLRPMDGARVLDVGTGTGAVAQPAMIEAGSAGLVVGIDAAVEMLRFARRAAEYPLAVAQIPHLPFPDGVFDLVLAGFVISHLSNYATGLAEMVRVCQPGGRVGMTSWGVSLNPAARLWTETASQYLPTERLDDAVRAHIPWDDWLSRAANVERSLEDASLISVAVDTREYRFALTTGDYLLSREASVQGIVLREACSSPRWDHFTQRVADVFRERFGDTVEYVRDVHFGVGTTRSA